MKNFITGVIVGLFIVTTTSVGAWYSYQAQLDKDRAKYIEYKNCKLKVSKDSCACENLNPLS